MFQSDLLKGKIIFVTGGGTGLGRSMAQRFLELQAKVVIASRKMDTLQETAAELIEATGGEVLPLALDVRDYKAVEIALEQSLNHFGSIDILLNNAAGNFVSPMDSPHNNMPPYYVLTYIIKKPAPLSS